ncbi:MAG: 2-oxoglutarate dehydrogenase complex dihydrolipoyllysine-residue succinyltransferase [Tistlia sp.]|uniref:2-oxoglutarate dehydrogenase complex dihydrolipoyllysine-residue succinyltransferase n=1 Tax=Tistlia sp. TaxID=3057121 RepID=UPI0034A547D0
MPTLGESVSEAVVAKWLKQAGDSVAADEAIAELETDKVSLEVNAPVAGTLSETLVEEGASVEVGTVLARVTEGDGAAAPAPAPAPGPAAGSKPAAKGPSDAVQEGDTGAGSVTGPLDPRGQAQGDEAALAAAPGLDPSAARRTDGKVTASDLAGFLAQGVPSSAMTLSPAVARLVEQHGLDPYRIPATGPQGRLTKEDVEAVVAGRAELKPKPAVSGRAAPAPAAQPAGEARAETPSGPRERRERMSKLRQTIARRLKEAQNSAAMLTTFNEADMSAVMALRNRYKEGFEKKHGVKLGFTAFFAKACVKALKEVPSVNARIDGTDMVFNEFYDIGMAVSAPQGLMVPVIRDCDGKSFAEIEKALGDLAGRARDGKLSLDEMQGGSFTITNGGVFGSLLSTPILNAPQSGILGLHKIQERPVAIEGAVEIRPMMYLALSYDHRIVDGREAVTFLVKVKEAVEDPERLLLDL